MTDEDEKGFFGSLADGIIYWLEPPQPGRDEDDDVWSDFHLFQGHWIEIQNRLDRYESPNVPQIYKDHKYIFKQNMDMPRPEETYYFQNADSGEFEAKIYDDEDLPSSRGQLRIETNMKTKYAPSGENDFAGVDYVVTTKIRYSDIPNGITFLPRFLARPLNRLFRKAFLRILGEEMVDRDGEYARERTTEYTNYVRKYHGEEPMQSRTRQAEFRPVPEDGTFFQ